MIVVDASLAMTWCFQSRATETTDKLLQEVAESGGIVPPLWKYETANALITANRRGLISDAQMQTFAELLASLPLDVVNSLPNIPYLLVLALRYNLTSYDAAYLELALRLNQKIGTLDKKLRQAAESAGVAIVPM